MKLIFAQTCSQHGNVEFFLAEQGKLAAVLKAKEVGQAGRGDTFGASGRQ